MNLSLYVYDIHSSDLNHKGVKLYSSHVLRLESNKCDFEEIDNSKSFPIKISDYEGLQNLTKHSEELKNEYHQKSVEVLFIEFDWIEPFGELAASQYHFTLKWKSVTSKVFIITLYHWTHFECIYHMNDGIARRIPWKNRNFICISLLMFSIFNSPHTME